MLIYDIFRHMVTANVKNTDIHIGDTIRVKTTVVEGGKTRIQSFEGILIALHGRDVNKTMTVRRIGARGVGVERIWPIDAKSIVEVEVAKTAKKVRRSKLYYLRNLTGKAATQV